MKSVTPYLYKNNKISKNKRMFNIIMLIIISIIVTVYIFTRIIKIDNSLSINIRLMACLLWNRYMNRLMEFTDRKSCAYMEWVELPVTTNKPWIKLILQTVFRINHKKNMNWNFRCTSLDGHSKTVNKNFYSDKFPFVYLNVQLLLSL